MKSWEYLGRDQQNDKNKMKMEDYYREVALMNKPIPPHRNAVEPFQDLTRRIEQLERQAKGFRMFCGSIVFLCVAGFIISAIFRLMNT